MLSSAPINLVQNCTMDKNWLGVENMNFRLWFSIELLNKLDVKIWLNELFLITIRIIKQDRKNLFKNQDYSDNWWSAHRSSAVYLQHSLKHFHETWLKCLAPWDNVQKTRVSHFGSKSSIETFFIILGDFNLTFGQCEEHKLLCASF